MHSYLALLLIIGCQLVSIGILAFFTNRWYQKQPNKLEARKRLNKSLLIGTVVLLVITFSLSVHSYLTTGRIHLSTSSLLLVMISILTTQQAKLNRLPKSH